MPDRTDRTVPLSYADSAEMARRQGLADAKARRLDEPTPADRCKCGATAEQHGEDLEVPCVEIDPVERNQSKHVDAAGALRYDADGSEVFPGPTGVRRPRCRAAVGLARCYGDAVDRGYCAGHADQYADDA